MGAHSTPGATAPTGARIATTALAVAVTGVLGTGTALAHDDAGHHGHGGSHGSTSDADPSARTQAAQARADADSTLRDVLAQVGLTSASGTSGTSGADDSGYSAEDTGGSATSTATADRSSSTAPPATSAPARPRTSTQPIAAPGSDVPAELPPVGETQTIPIR